MGTPGRPIDVSVIVINWNTASYLARCLDSLSQGGLEGASAEVWVIDNGSTDGSADLVRTRYPWVRLQANERNLGFAVANNRVMRMARGRFFLLLNADTSVPLGTVQGLVERVERSPDVGVAGCRQRDGEGRLLESYALDYMHGRVPEPRPFGSAAGDQPGVIEVAWVWGAVMAVRREAFEQVGGFDEGFFLYYEDLEWCWRLRRAGWRIVVYPDLEVVHFVRRSTERVPISVTARRLVSGELLILGRFMPPRRYRDYLVARFLYAVRGVVFYRTMLAIAPSRRFRERYFRYLAYLIEIPAHSAWATRLAQELKRRLAARGAGRQTTRDRQ